MAEKLARSPRTNGQKSSAEASLPIRSIETAKLGRPKHRWEDHQHLEL